jgi:tripartite-type tricarboxylate transporter receptor subunit TctC
MFAPAGTPDVVVNRLNDALQKTVADPAVVKAWAAEDVSVFPLVQRSPAAAGTLLQSEITRWGQVIRENNIHIEQ